MADTRRARGNWVVSKDGSVPSWEAANCAVLMDLRDVPDNIHSLLSCYRIQKMFKTIDRIDKRLSKKIKLHAR